MKIDRIHIKGKESFIASFITLFVSVVLLVPILLLISIKFLFSSVKKVRSYVLSVTKIDSPLLEKVY